MFLIFLSRQESFSVEFGPDAHPVCFQPDNHVSHAMSAKTHQQGSRKAPLPAKHFFAEVRLNPSKRLLLLRPQARLTRFASDWVLKRQNPAEKSNHPVYIVEYADRFALDIYKLMDWDNSFSYTVTGLTASPSFVASMSNRSFMGDLTTDTVHVGDYYFNLNHANPNTRP